MDEEHRGRGVPPRGYEGARYAPAPLPSLGGPLPPPPPPNGRPDEHESPNHNGPNMAAGVSLPPLSAMSDYPPYSGRPGQQGPPLEPRSRGSYSVSPTESGSYPSSVSGQVLPPMSDQRGVDPRMNDPRAGPPPDPRQAMPFRPAPHEQNGQLYAPGPQRSQPYPPHPDQYHPYHRQQPPPQMGLYPVDYRGPPGGMAQQQSSAPRQRTSIACRYCRKRKIRCSGYQTEAHGKCNNCKKTGNECVFQPVSSSSTTAFVPVSALQGGVPPGTPLYGAFGQPLNAGAPVPPQHMLQHPHPGHPPHPGSMQQSPPQLSLPSPTGSYYDDRVEPGRRRPRGPDDDQHGPRLPPPLPGQIEEDPRRRSPASAQSQTPPMSYPTYPRTSSTPPTHQLEQQRGAAGLPPRRDSPAANGPTTNGSAQGPSSVMSLNNLMDFPPPRTVPGDGRHIDNDMLGRLNRRP